MARLAPVKEDEYEFALLGLLRSFLFEGQTRFAFFMILWHAAKICYDGL